MAGIDEVYAVTLLTSLGPDEVHVQYGSETSSAVVVRRLALLAKAAGVHGIVCSPQEVSLVRNAIGEGIKIVVPGVRSVGAEVHDQKRTGTHGQALIDGANLLVIGRQMTKAEDPVTALDQIETEIEQALTAKEATS